MSNEFIEFLSDLALLGEGDENRIILVLYVLVLLQAQKFDLNNGRVNFGLVSEANCHFSTVLRLNDEIGTDFWYPLTD